MRLFDIVVYGATGFTGRRIASRIASHQERRKLRWAVAGRNRSRVSALAEKYGADGVIVADARDQASLQSMIANTKLVISAVGPYLDHGEALVEACARAGTDYLDLAGEPEFVDDVFERWGPVAERSGARLIPACGFESVPHDLGVLLTVSMLPSDQSIEVRSVVSATLGFSVGSWQSAITALSRARAYIPRRRSREAQARAREVRAVRTLRPRLWRDSELGAWACPFPTVDVDIIKRSARALPTYGASFSYGHYLAVQRLRTVTMGAVSLGGFALACQHRITRGLLRRVRPPSRREETDAQFKLIIRGEAGGLRAQTTVCGGDPGYDESAKLIVESALCLNFEKAAAVAGATTAAVAFGHALIERLRNAGIQFDVQAPNDDSNENANRREVALAS